MFYFSQKHIKCNSFTELYRAIPKPLHFTPVLYKCFHFLHVEGVRGGGCSVLGPWFSVKGDFTHTPGTFDTWRVFLVVITGELFTDLQWVEPGMLLTTPQCTGQPLVKRITAPFSNFPLPQSRSHQDWLGGDVSALAQKKDQQAQGLCYVKLVKSFSHSRLYFAPM